MSRKQTPFDKILSTQNRLRLYVQFGEQALQGQDVSEFLKEVEESFGYLMDFRNIINGMVRFEETPQEAVLPYLDDVL